MKYAYFLAGLVIGVAIAAASAQVRLEAGIGQCQHSLAIDGSWHYMNYGNYQNNIEINPVCEQIGVSWTPIHKRGLDFGLRAALVDLGQTTADNTYPRDESVYFSAAASHGELATPTDHFTAHGRSSGFSIGPVIQKQVGDWNIGAEAGIAVLYSTWHASTPLFADWRYADAWRWSHFVGAQVRYRWLMLSVRRYADVGAWNPCDGCWGMTLGPLIQTTVGVSIPL